MNSAGSLYCCFVHLSPVMNVAMCIKITWAPNDVTCDKMACCVCWKLNDSEITCYLSPKHMHYPEVFHSVSKWNGRCLAVLHSGNIGESRNTYYHSQGMSTCALPVPNIQMYLAHVWICTCSLNAIVILYIWFYFFTHSIKEWVGTLHVNNLINIYFAVERYTKIWKTVF